MGGKKSAPSATLEDPEGVPFIGSDGDRITLFAPPSDYLVGEFKQTLIAEFYGHLGRTKSKHAGLWKALENAFAASDPQYRWDFEAAFIRYHEDTRRKSWARGDIVERIARIDAFLRSDGETAALAFNMGTGERMFENVR